MALSTSSKQKPVLSFNILIDSGLLPVTYPARMSIIPMMRKLGK